MAGRPIILRPPAWSRVADEALLPRARHEAGARATAVRFSASLAALPGRVIDDHGRQVLHLLLGNAELDAVVDPGDGADRDGYFLAAEHVPLLQEHMGHVVVARVDDKPLD